MLHQRLLDTKCFLVAHSQMEKSGIQGTGVETE